MLISSLASASLFAVFTYIKPILTDVSGLSVGAVTWVLLLVRRRHDHRQHHRRQAGRLEADADRHRFARLHHPRPPELRRTRLRRASRRSSSSSSGASSPSSSCPPLQMRVVQTASDGPNLAATLNQGAFNVGNAAGALGRRHRPFVRRALPGPALRRRGRRCRSRSAWRCSRRRSTARRPPPASLRPPNSAGPSLANPVAPGRLRRYGKWHEEAFERDELVVGLLTAA